MKIERLVVTGFGRLAGCEFTLAAGANIFFGPNEAGKTTLWHFICAMLYGLKEPDAQRRRWRPEQDRYAPWSGAPYGGVLEFRAADGRLYRVERSFDRKDDRVELSDAVTGQRLNAAYATDRRRELLFAEHFTGMNELVFQRTACMRALPNAGDEKGRRELAARLANLQESGEEATSVRRAVDVLESRRKALVTRCRQADKRADEARQRWEELQEHKVATRALEQKLRQLDEQEAALQQAERRARAAALMAEAEALQECAQQIANTAGELTRCRALIAQEEERLGAFAPHADPGCAEAVGTAVSHMRALVEQLRVAGAEVGEAEAKAAAAVAACAQYSHLDALPNAAPRVVSELLELARQAGAEAQRLQHLAERQIRLAAVATAVRTGARAAAGWLYAALACILLLAALVLLPLRDRLPGGFLPVALAAITAAALLWRHRQGGAGAQEAREQEAARQQEEAFLAREEAQCAQSRARIRQRLEELLRDAGCNEATQLARAEAGAGREAAAGEYTLSQQAEAAQMLQQLAAQAAAGLLSAAKAATLAELKETWQSFTQARAEVNAANLLLEDRRRLWQRRLEQASAWLRQEASPILATCAVPEPSAAAPAGRREALVWAEEWLRKLEEAQAHYTALAAGARHLEAARCEAARAEEALADKCAVMQQILRRLATLVAAGDAPQETELAAQIDALLSAVSGDNRYDRLTAEAAALAANLTACAAAMWGALPLPAEGDTQELANALSRLVEEHNELRRSRLVVETELAHHLRASEGEERWMECCQEAAAAREEAAIALSATELALAELAAAAEEVHRQFAPALNAEVSQCLSRLTGGRYREAVISENLDIRLTDPTYNRQVDLNALSSGTCDQVYFAFRLAAAQAICGERLAPPFLVDDVFAHYDDTRCYQGLAALADVAREAQVLFFTCHGRERDMLARLCEQAGVACKVHGLPAERTNI